MCGAKFDIDDTTLSEICNPLSVHTDIHCPSCETDGMVYTFEWSDTGENLFDFRNRLRSNMPLLLRHVDSKTTLHVCLLTIAISGAIAVHYDNIYLAIPALASLIYYVMALLIGLIWSIAANFGDVI